MSVCRGFDETPMI